MIKRINLIVEGQTEEFFVKRILAPYLASYKTFVSARRVETGRKGPKIHRGGMTSYSKAKNDIQHWLREDQQALVSTMFDFYGLPTDFPGITGLVSDPRQSIAMLETALKVDIPSSRFIPYIQLHEFEALLFSDPQAIQDSVPGQNCVKKLEAILSSFSNDPELINNNPATAPSKRLCQLYPRYDKVAYGAKIAENIGIEKLRSKCLNFDSWIKKLI